MLLGFTTLPRRRLAAGLAAWFALAATARAQSSGEAETPPALVTSDTPQFCARLAEQLRQEIRSRRPAAVSDEVRMLEREGRRMCREGHVRPGILRIRRALMILKGE